MNGSEDDALGIRFNELVSWAAMAVSTKEIVMLCSWFEIWAISVL